jgi:hypothetical protein
MFFDSSGLHVLDGTISRKALWTAASEMPSQVALLARELKFDERWQQRQAKAFQELALGYMVA